MPIQLDRRGILRLGVGASAAAFLATGGAVYSAITREPKPGSGREVLTDDEARFFAAASEVYFPPGNAIGINAGEVDIAGILDRWMAPMPPTERGVIRFLFRLVDRWPQLSFQGGRFVSLSLAERTALLEEFHASGNPAKENVDVLLRTVVSIAFFEEPRALAGAGHVFGCAA